MKLNKRFFLISSLAEIKEFVMQKPAAYQSNMVETVLKNIKEASKIRNKNNRVILVKLILTFLPQTKAEIIKILTQRNSRLDFELHFTIFCFLDQIREIRQSGKRKFNVPEIIEDYLMKIKDNTCQAAWMAGELLGVNWDKKNALTVLKKVFFKAKNKTGKEAGLYGLYQIYLEHRSQEALLTLKKIFLLRKNSSISKYAIYLLERL